MKVYSENLPWFLAPFKRKNVTITMSLPPRASLVLCGRIFTNNSDTPTTCSIAILTRLPVVVFKAKLAMQSAIGKMKVRLFGQL